MLWNICSVSAEARSEGLSQLYEVDITKFVDIANKRIKEVFPETNLKRIPIVARSGKQHRSHLFAVTERKF